MKLSGELHDAALVVLEADSHVDLSWCFRPTTQTWRTTWRSKVAMYVKQNLFLLVSFSHSGNHLAKFVTKVPQDRAIFMSLLSLRLYPTISMCSVRLHRWNLGTNRIIKINPASLWSTEQAYLAPKIYCSEGSRCVSLTRCPNNPMLQTSYMPDEARRA